MNYRNNSFNKINSFNQKNDIFQHYNFKYNNAINPGNTYNYQYNQKYDNDNGLIKKNHI